MAETDMNGSNGGSKAKILQAIQRRYSGLAVRLGCRVAFRQSNPVDNPFVACRLVLPSPAASAQAF